MSEQTLNLSETQPLPFAEEDWQKNVPYSFRGLGIVIEYLAGETRTKIRDSGIAVSGEMPVAYGYILKTTDIHGEEIDVYLASNPNERADVYVIDQVCPFTGMFDEHKVMLGFDSDKDAIETYVKVFGDGSGKKRLGAITVFPAETFSIWLLTEGYSLQPASKAKVSGSKTAFVSGIATPRPNPKSFPKPIDEAGGVIVSLPDLSQGPRLSTSVSELGGISYKLNLFSAIDTKVWSNVVDTFCRALDLSSEQDEVHIHIASPGGSVFLMGRIISAVKKTKAKVYTYAQGCVASAATTVWASGHERYILPGAYFMQHMSSQLMSGKTTDIAAKAVFCVNYITRQLQPLLDIGLFTQQEVTDMVEKSSDIFIAGREAISRVGKVSSGNRVEA